MFVRKANDITSFYPSMASQNAQDNNANCFTGMEMKTVQSTKIYTHCTVQWKMAAHCFNPKEREDVLGEKG